MLDYKDQAFHIFFASRGSIIEISTQPFNSLLNSSLSINRLIITFLSSNFAFIIRALHLSYMCIHLIKSLWKRMADGSWALQNKSKRLSCACGKACAGMGIRALYAGFRYPGNEVYIYFCGLLTIVAGSISLQSCPGTVQLIR